MVKIFSITSNKGHFVKLVVNKTAFFVGISDYFLHRIGLIKAW